MASSISLEFNTVVPKFTPTHLLIAVFIFIFSVKIYSTLFSPEAWMNPIPFIRPYHASGAGFLGVFSFIPRYNTTSVYNHHRKEIFLLLRPIWLLLCLCCLSVWIQATDISKSIGSCPFSRSYCCWNWNSEHSQILERYTPSSIPPYVKLCMPYSHTSSTHSRPLTTASAPSWWERVGAWRKLSHLSRRLWR